MNRSADYYEWNNSERELKMRRTLVYYCTHQGTSWKFEVQVIDKKSFKELITSMNKMGVNFIVKRFGKATYTRIGINVFWCNEAVITLPRNCKEFWLKYEKGQIKGVNLFHTDSYIKEMDEKIKNNKHKHKNKWKKLKQKLNQK